MDTAAKNVRVGITTDELDRIVHEVEYELLYGCDVIIVVPCVRSPG